MLLLEWSSIELHMITSHHKQSRACPVIIDNADAWQGYPRSVRSTQVFESYMWILLVCRLGPSLETRMIIPLAILCYPCPQSRVTAWPARLCSQNYAVKFNSFSVRLYTSRDSQEIDTPVETYKTPLHGWGVDSDSKQLLRAWPGPYRFRLATVPSHHRKVIKFRRRLNPEKENRHPWTRQTLILSLSSPASSADRIQAASLALFTNFLPTKIVGQLRGRRALMLFKDVPLRTRRALALYTKSMAIAPFWFSTEHRWKVLLPFWDSADKMKVESPRFFPYWNDQNNYNILPLETAWRIKSLYPVPHFQEIRINSYCQWTVWRG